MIVVTVGVAGDDQSQVVVVQKWLIDSFEMVCREIDRLGLETWNRVGQDSAFHFDSGKSYFPRDKTD